VIYHYFKKTDMGKGMEYARGFSMGSGVKVEFRKIGKI